LRNIEDHYFKKAKAQGYVARSAFKLEEVDKKNNLVRKGYKVIDLGCFPGSWMQYISNKIGDKGLVLGVDIQELELSLSPNMRFIHGDIHELDIETLEPYSRVWDLVVSDMAPNTTGNRSTDSLRSFALCEMALEVAARFLRPGGNCLVKSLQGQAQEDLLKRMRAEYNKVKSLRPQSTRKESKEVFVLGIGKKGVQE